MKSRNKTLWTNVAIYASIALIGAFNVYFWRSHIVRKRAEIADLRNQLATLETEKLRTQQEFEKATNTKATVEAETERRRQELAGYGEFLRDVSEKPESIENLQAVIEREGIAIQRVAYSELGRGQGANYYTFGFTLELEGPYSAFKSLLYKLPRESQIYRIKSFDVKRYDNEDHNWQVTLQLETYFSGQI